MVKVISVNGKIPLVNGKAIEAIEASEMFHAEITPATSGEVLTLEVGEKGERIAAMIVSAKVGTGIEAGKNYGIQYIATINSAEISANPSVYNLIIHKDGVFTREKSDKSAHYANSTPSGKQVYSAYNIWNSTNVKPWVKFYITDGAESKYGLIVGLTYDIWVIKAG